MNLSNVLALVPGLGAAFRDPAAPKSEYDLACGAIAAIVALPDVPGWARAVGIGLAAGLYIWSRTAVKIVASAAEVK
jgi:hypothetical protein